MTPMHKSRLDTNKTCILGLATNLRALAHECPEQRTDLIRAAVQLERAHETLDEITCVPAR